MRKDLEVRLPIVYNGRSVEEWYTLYTQLALTTAREKTIRAELVSNGSGRMRCSHVIVVCGHRAT